MSDEEFDAEYHRRLASKSPSEAGKSIGQSALVATGGIDRSLLTPETNPQGKQGLEDYGLHQSRTAQFIGQGGQVETRPYEDISNSYVDKRGIVRPGVIDARAPVKFGGALTPNSLSSDADWKAKFQPSPELQQLNDRRDAINAASRVSYAPVNSPATPTFQPGAYPQSGSTNNFGTIAQVDDSGGIPSDPMRKFFGGGLPTPSPTPVPTPTKMVDETPYWRKRKEDQYA